MPLGRPWLPAGGAPVLCGGVHPSTVASVLPHGWNGGCSIGGLRYVVAAKPVAGHAREDDGQVFALEELGCAGGEHRSAAFAAQVRAEQGRADGELLGGGERVVAGH